MRFIPAIFDGGNRATTPALYQWDYGQALRFDGAVLPDTFEVLFWADGKSVTVLGQAGEAQIPDALLKTGASIEAFIYLHQEETDGETVYSVVIPVKPRPAPTEPEMLPEEKSLIAELIAKLDTAVHEADAYAQEAEAAATAAAASADEAAQSAASIPAALAAIREEIAAIRAELDGKVTASDTGIITISDGFLARNVNGVVTLDFSAPFTSVASEAGQYKTLVGNKLPEILRPLAKIRIPISINGHFAELVVNTDGNMQQISPVAVAAGSDLRGTITYTR